MIESIGVLLSDTHIPLFPHFPLPEFAPLPKECPFSDIEHSHDLTGVKIKFQLLEEAQAAAPAPASPQSAFARLMDAAGRPYVIPRKVAIPPAKLNEKQELFNRICDYLDENGSHFTQHSSREATKTATVMCEVLWDLTSSASA